MGIKSCAFTGHRPDKFSFKYNEESPDCKKCKTTLKKVIIRLCYSGVTKFYTGMAIGIDIWAAEIVLSLQKEFDLELYCIIPFKGQEDNWSYEYQERYRHILECCRDEVYINEDYDKRSYKKRNKFLVDNAEVLVAVFDKKMMNSGTRQTVRMALKCKKEIIYINTTDFEITKEKYEIDGGISI